MKKLIAILSIGFIALASAPMASAHDHGKKCCGSEKCQAEQAECCGDCQECPTACSKGKKGPIAAILGGIGGLFKALGGKKGDCSSSDCKTEKECCGSCQS